LLQTSSDLNPDARARIAEEGYFIETANPVGSGEVIPSKHDTSTQPFLEVEFALVIARMIDSVRNNPKDIRQVIYDLARYKLQDQLLQANTEEREDTRRALEFAIRGVESFSEKHADIRPPERHPQLNALPSVAADREGVRATSAPPPEAVHQVGSSLPPVLERKARSSTRGSRLPYLKRAAAMLLILAAILISVQQRERLQKFALGLPKLEWKTAVAGRLTAPEDSHPVVSVPPPAKSAALRPTDYGVYAISNDALFDLSPLPGRPPDIRIAVSAVLTTPGRTIIPRGHPKFIVFSPNITSSITDRADIRIIAKIAREFSTSNAGQKAGDDAWVIRNISFPLRSSPVSDNPEMYELHSEDPALELSPGRYALVLKNQAYDFSVEGNEVDSRQCIERIVGPTGVFYSDCKNPPMLDGLRR
jgi:hypothetical protein